CAPDLIREDETGYVYALANVEALASRVSTIRQRSVDGHQWADACRRMAEAHSYVEATSGLVGACRAVLVHSPGPEPDWPRASRRIIACCGQMVIAGGLERVTFHILRTVRDGGAASHCIVNGWENHRITPLAESAAASWSTGPYWHALTRRHLTPAK